MRSPQVRQQCQGVARGGFSPGPPLSLASESNLRQEKKKKTQVLVEHDGSFPSFCCRPTAGTPLRPEAVSIVDTEYGNEGA